MLDDPVTYSTIPQVSALNTYVLMQSLKKQLRSIPPPKDSPLHGALACMPPPSTKRSARELAVPGRGVRFSVPPPPPASCPDDLRPMYARMASVYHDMLEQDAANNDPSHSLLQRSYQFKTATEMRQHIVDAERDVAALAVKEERVLRTARQLGLWDLGAKITHAADANDATEGKVEPVYWQKNFAALLQNSDPSLRYLMPQDNF
jgi:hypothetical protein